MLTNGQAAFKSTLLQQWRYEATRVRRFVDALTSDVTQDELNWQSRPGHHSMWHHIWHMFLVHDFYFAAALQTTTTWESGAWASKIELGSMQKILTVPGMCNWAVPKYAICGVPDQIVDELKAPPLDQFMAYVNAMLSRCESVLDAATEQQLGREFKIGESPELAGFRAINLSHVFRHIGMMEDLKGLMRGPGKGSATI